MNRVRVVAGSAGGLWIKLPKKFTSRPTQDRVKQAIFSALGARVVESGVLDLYAGSGALGIEALSRGASSCTFVDRDRACIAAIEENLIHTRLQGICTCSTSDLYLQSCAQKFDLILADPPYDDVPKNMHEWNLIQQVANCLKSEGVFILEHRTGSVWENHSELVAFKNLRHGDTSVLFLRRSTTTTS